MRLYFITLTVSLLAVLELTGLTGCSRHEAEPASIDLAYSAAAAKRSLDSETAQTGRKCRIVGNYGAGQYALIEASCEDGGFIEYGYYGSNRVLSLAHVWRAKDAAARVTEEDLMLDLSAPQMEAWMLIDKRDRP